MTTYIESKGAFSQAREELPGDREDSLEMQTMRFGEDVGTQYDRVDMKMLGKKQELRVSAPILLKNNIANGDAA